ncbi:DUF2237 family protein [Leeuwenhoekiella sp. NPDC079379]|uniref:DUF2237 family protein n=1 Tax=Leeuwenhoekiella sp. NPDC079379 TaxID=3364122 RepID=UPI0037C8511E
MNQDFNIYGRPLQACCFNPKTGYFRDGFCRTIEEDYGTHILCAIVTEEFLRYSASKGNDLMTPIPHWDFPGLKPGDSWCLCISRWLEAEKKGVAPRLNLEACHQDALNYTTLAKLEAHTI